MKGIITLSVISRGGNALADSVHPLRLHTTEVATRSLFLLFFHSTPNSTFPSLNSILWPSACITSRASCSNEIYSLSFSLTQAAWIDFAIYMQLLLSFLCTHPTWVLFRLSLFSSTFFHHSIVFPRCYTFSTLSLHCLVQFC